MRPHTKKQTMDKRRLLRASPPSRTARTIQVHLDPEDYEKLYFMALDSGQSLADEVRELVRSAPDVEEGFR